MKNIFYKATKPQQPATIDRPKLKVTTVGYINLISRRQGATATFKKGIAKIKTFASRRSLKAYQVLDQLKTKALKAKKLVGAFIKGARLEANILTAKFEFNRALHSLESSYFVATKYLSLINAYFQLRTFKSSLPKYIRFNLF
jgi:hypothetical protein